MTSPSKLSRFFGSPRFIALAKVSAAGVVISVLIWFLQFSTDAICCGDFDGYYHIKWSRMIWESMRAQTFPPLFVWLPHTTLDANHYVDHHFLFHVFQIPFTWFGDLRTGAKVSAFVFASLALLTSYWLLVRYQIRYSFVWLIALLACSAPFLYRMNMAKAPPFAIIYLVLGIHLLFRRKYWPLLPLAFLFTLTYDMFPLLFITAIFWSVVIGWTEKRFAWQPLLWVAIGIGAGLVINPYFPNNFELLFAHLKMKITPSDYTTKVGGEWYPYDTWEFMGNSLVALVAMVMGYIFFDASDKKRAQYPLLLLLVSTTLMIMTARWKRIAEYWPPFAVMFAAFSLQPWVEGARSKLSQMPTDILDELQPYLDREPAFETIKQRNARELWNYTIAAGVAVILGVVLAVHLSGTRYSNGLISDIAASEPHEHYRDGADWLKANVPSGQIIFNTDWDDFPRLFYFDPTHNYVSGLDPTYLYDKDPKLSQLYDRITLGEEQDPGPLIRDRFNSRYVFTDNAHDNFFSNAIESGWFEIVYEDADCTVLHILDFKKGQEPDEAELEIGLEPIE